MFSKVIVGVDGHDGGRDAAALGKALSSGPLTLVGAYPSDAVPSRGTLPGYEQLLRDDMQGTLESARAQAGVDGELLAVGDNSPARALQLSAERLDADLIVVGSAHHGPLGRLLLGDVGRAVLHGSPCPVAVAPKNCGADPPRTIAVGLDDSPAARAALDLASRYAAESNAALTVIVVWEDPPLPIAEAAMIYDLERMKADKRKGADQLLADALDALPSSTGGQVLHGRPGTVLAESAERFGLLVVGSRGWGPVKRIAIGSTADRLMHHLPCPLIIVPRPATEAGSGEEQLSAAETAD